MPALDIFNGDAFSVQSLTNAINDVAHLPTRLAELGLFTEQGITTTTVSIEKQGMTLSMVASAPRGTVVKPKDKEKRVLIPLRAIHLPQTGGLNADEVQNVRAFGSETELESVTTMVNRELTRMRRNIDATLEYQRIGAVKGQVLDADGTTVLLDLYTTFGVTQQVKDMVLGTAGTKVITKCLEAKRLLEQQLGGIMYSGIRVLCSAAFFDAFTTHANVEAAYLNYMSGPWTAQDKRRGFTYAGMTFEEYRGSVGGVDFIAAGDAYMIPEGVPELFNMYFAPADYMETVNTNGLPYYAKQELRDMAKGVDIEAQSNPLTFCTRPSAIIKLTVA